MILYSFAFSVDPSLLDPYHDLNALSFKRFQLPTIRIAD